jgi:uncharacterized OB-fold protein
MRAMTAGRDIQAMAAYAAERRLALQRCTSCGHVQYPPRELCGACLADTLEWRVTAAERGEVLAHTVLHHSHEPAFAAMLPLRIALVRLDAGPTVVCFLAEGCTAGMHVSVTAQLDNDGRPILFATIAMASLAPTTRGTS